METATIEITRKEEDIVRSCAFMSKIRYNDMEFKKSIEELYRKDPFNTENALTYAMYNWFITRNDKAVKNYDMEASLIIMKNILEAVENILSVQHGNWLARIIKVRLLLLSVNTEEEAIEELNLLMDYQNSGGYRPHHIVTYLLLSETYFSMADREKAEYYLAQAEVLNKEPVDIISDFLFVSLKEYRNKLKRSGEFKMADRVSVLMDEFFHRQ